MSRSTLTLASSLLPADIPDEQKNALLLSACILLTANPNLPPHDAVGDAMQLWETISE